MQNREVSQAQNDTRRLRVVYLDHVARLSGGELALLHTLPALLAEVDPLVVLAEDGPLVAALTAIGVECRVIPLSAAARDLRRGRSVSGLRWRAVVDLVRYVTTLRRLLRAEQAQLVHTNSLKSAMYGAVAGRLARVPVVWHLRDRIDEDYLPRLAVRLVRALARTLPSAVVASSATVLATLHGSPGLAATSRVVYDGITHVSEPSQRTGGSLMVGMVGRLSPWKGQDLFLRAFARAFPAGDEQAILIGSAMFGEDDFAASLPLLAATLGIGERVAFAGFQADVERELSRLDVLVHCSTTPEPFGQVILEGMAAGLPVLASGEGGTTEIVTDGVDGLLVQPRDVDALATALRRLAQDAPLRAALGAAGRATAARFTPEATASGLIEVYSLALRRPWPAG